jgi:hypothetical protein
MLQKGSGRSSSLSITSIRVSFARPQDDPTRMEANKVAANTFGKVIFSFLLQSGDDVYPYNFQGMIISVGAFRSHPDTIREVDPNVKSITR